MEKWNIVEILKVGLPGLVFLLSMLSYLLLANEQKKETSDARILSAIKSFMYVNIFLAILTAASPIIDSVFPREVLEEETFRIQAKKGDGNLEQGKVLVCHDARYANRFLLITSNETGKMVQVFSGSIMPCPKDKKEQLMVITEKDAQNLGWKTDVSQDFVEVVSARPGFQFALSQKP